MTSSSQTCWACNSKTITIFKESNLEQTLTSDSFAITDSAYGQTTKLGKCNTCDFIQCIENINVLEHYNNLEDFGYEESRKERMLQSKKILDVIKKYTHGEKLLDIGAGSGILVEQAITQHYKAVGIEPSLWLQKKATEKNIPVVQGIFPHKEITGLFDVITLIDVIEHVDNPFSLVTNIKEHLNKKGIFVVITPNVSSLIARALQKRWWHFRVAHIGYFNKKNLNIIMKRAGYKQVHLQNATWYFSIEYLFERTKRYLPFLSKIQLPGLLKKVIIPLNLGDSIFAIYTIE
jgi:SAM-dependent methyltransferase